MEERVGAPPGHKIERRIDRHGKKELRRHRTAHLTAHEARDADIVALFGFADALHNLNPPAARQPLVRVAALGVGDGQAIGVAVLLSSRGAKRILLGWRRRRGRKWRRRGGGRRQRHASVANRLLEAINVDRGIHTAQKVGARVGDGLAAALKGFAICKAQIGAQRHNACSVPVSTGAAKTRGPPAPPRPASVFNLPKQRASVRRWHLLGATRRG